MRRTILPCIAAVLLLAGCSGSHDDTYNLNESASSARSTVYSCDDGTDFVADFIGSNAILSIASGPTVTLKQQPFASGLLYTNGAYEFRGKGSSYLLRRPGHRAANCAGMM
jgi:membrane-bound inhibitor of C-type lysozyme